MNDFGGYDYGGDEGAGGFNPMGYDGLAFGGDGGGGGFMNDANNSGQKNEKKGGRERQSLRPVSIKQLLTMSTDNDINTIDGVEVVDVKIMGVIENVEHNSTTTVYMIHDGTGLFKCQHWIDSNNNTSANAVSKQLLKKHTFVRVFGILKNYENKSFLLINDISIVEDLNELSHHLLEIIYVHLQHTKGPIPGSIAVQQRAGMMLTPQHTGQRLNISLQDNNSSLNDHVLTAVRGTSSESGAHVDEIFNYLRSGLVPNVTIKSVKDVLKSLSDNGFVYSTIDEEHFLTT